MAPPRFRPPPRTQAAAAADAPQHPEFAPDTVAPPRPHLTRAQRAAPRPRGHSAL